MSYHGDIRLGDTIDLKFTTRQISGAPFTLAGTPVISAYPSNSLTELTAGITLTADFDSRTGLNHVRVVASSGNGYATATNYELVITTGTVNSVSVVGEVIGSFSIEARSAVMPTTAARTLDVSAGGEAGVDWANVGTPGSTVNLSATTTNLVNTLTTYTGNTVQTGDSFARLGAPAGASVSADIASISSGGLTAAGVRSAVGLATANLDTQLAALPTANENADALLDRTDGIESSWTIRKGLRIMLSVLAGKASGLNTTTAVYRDMADSKNRISADVDASGNRTSVTRDAT